MVGSVREAQRVTLGNKIQKLRKQNGMSQEKLAEELGVTRQAVSKWELDAALPDIGNVVALSQLFGVTTDYLLKDDVQTDAPPDNTHKIRNSSRKRLAGIICMITGAASMFLTYITSRFVPVMTPIRVYNDGKWWNHWNPDHVEVDYIYFIKEYKLELLLALFVIMILAGVILIFWDRRLKGIYNKVICKIKE